MAKKIKKVVVRKKLVEPKVFPKSYPKKTYLKEKADWESKHSKGVVLQLVETH